MNIKMFCWMKKSLRHSVNRIGSYEATNMGKKFSSLDYEIHNFY